MLGKKTSVFVFTMYFASLLLLVLVFIVGNKYAIPFEQMTGDPALICNKHPFTGIVSNIGALFWCTATCICLFTGLFLLKSEHKKEALFLISSGVFSATLLIDDFFMVHDYFLYSFDGFSISQPITYSIYALLMMWYVLKFYKIALKSNYFIMVIALVFLGFSVVVDLIFPSEGLEYFIEDSLKFIGIVSWMLYFTTTSFNLLWEKRSHL